MREHQPMREADGVDGADRTMHQARERLRTVFGFDDFRPGQADVIAAVLAGRDVLAVMPTGAGKSLCYQLPALMGAGLTIVVSPLIALMRDQVAQMTQQGIVAASLNSANAPAENAAAYNALRDGSLRLLYVAPERLVMPDMLDRLRAARPGLLAIDEAHCVSQWGHDFRPEYLELGRVRAELGDLQTAAFTATADAATRADIVAGLFADAPTTFVFGFDRPNLRLAMTPKANPARQLLAFLDQRRGTSGIVYCSSRKKTEKIAGQLAEAGFDAVVYHARLDKAARAAAQDRFQREDGVVVVATVAFGMGIDKPDVRFVVHADLPKSIEAYYQEIGRAGRDGLPADTLTLYGLEDMRLRRVQIEDSGAPEEQKFVERKRLAALITLCEAPRCRRQTLLAYFGEATEPCGNCDLCLGGVELFDGTVEAQKAMSAIVRTGERFGTEHLLAVLAGDETEAVSRWRHQRLPTFGVGADRDKRVWRAVFRQLNALGLISMALDRYAGWTVTPAGWAVLKGRETVALREDVMVAAPRRSKRAARAEIDTSAADPALLDALKALRRELAREQNVPAYVIFPDRTLIELAAARPRTLEAMHAVHGIGAAKLERYGAAFLDVVLDHAEAGDGLPDEQGQTTASPP